MNKRTTSTLMTRLRWGAFFLVLLFLVIKVMPRALGQRGQQDISKRTSDIQAPSDPASGSWTATGSLNTGRFLHTATLLPNGMVLVAGESDNSGNASATAELYDADTYAGRDHTQRVSTSTAMAWWSRRRRTTVSTPIPPATRGAPPTPTRCAKRAPRTA